MRLNRWIIEPLFSPMLFIVTIFGTTVLYLLIGSVGDDVTSPWFVAAVVLAIVLPVALFTTLALWKPPK